MNKEMNKHNCEKWHDEGRGCSICGEILVGIGPKDIKFLQEQVNWQIVELKKQLLTAKGDRTKMVKIKDIALSCCFGFGELKDYKDGILEILDILCEKESNE